MCAYEEHIPAASSTHWFNCKTSFQSKLKRIVLACKSSLDSPTEGKKLNEMRILQKDTGKWFKNNTAVGDEVTNSTNSPLKEMHKMSACCHYWADKCNTIMLWRYFIILLLLSYLSILECVNMYFKFTTWICVIPPVYLHSSIVDYILV